MLARMLPDDAPIPIPADDDIAGDAQFIYNWTVFVFMSPFFGFLRVVVIAVVACGALSTALPWIVRASLPDLPPGTVAGMSSAEAVGFVLLTLLDASFALSIRTNAGVSATAMYRSMYLLLAQCHAFITPRETQYARPPEPRTPASRPFPATAGDAPPVRVRPAPLPCDTYIVCAPMRVNDVVPPNLDHAVASAATRARLLAQTIDGLHGAVALDTVEGVRGLMYRLDNILSDGAPSGQGYVFMAIARYATDIDCRLSHTRASVLLRAVLH